MNDYAHLEDGLYYSDNGSNHADRNQHGRRCFAFAEVVYDRHTGNQENHLPDKEDIGERIQKRVQQAT